MNEKDAKRWQFVREGKIAIFPMLDEEGDMIGMFVETPTAAWECYSPKELDDNVDIAIHRQEFYEPSTLH